VFRLNGFECGCVLCVCVFSVCVLLGEKVCINKHIKIYTDNIYRKLHRHIYIYNNENKERQKDEKLPLLQCKSFKFSLNLIMLCFIIIIKF
jgi:hypothetical protein